jgi:cytoskeletal protein RodZ
MTSEKHHVDFGATLREARERRGLSLRVIADATKISVRALEALERNDISRLPGGIFSRSFVRAYALEVGLDPEQMIAEFITRFPVETVTQGHPRTRTLVDELETDTRRGVWPMFVWLLLAGVALTAALVYFGVVGRRAVPPVEGRPVVAASSHVTASQRAAAPFSITLHAVRATNFTVASDGQPGADVTLEASSSRVFHATRELLILPGDPSALEWSTDGGAGRGMTGPLTLTPDAILRATGVQ